MKKKNKKNHIRMRFSTLLLCCLAILLCAAPRGWAFSMKCTEGGVDVYKYSICVFSYEDEDGEYDVTEGLIEEIINTAPDEAGLEKGELLEMLDVCAGATVNLYTSVTYSVQAHPGSILNIHSGSVGYYVIVCLHVPYTDDADVTVYGKNFKVSNGAIEPEGKWLPDGGSGILTVTYTYGNGDTIELWFLSNDIPIKLKETDSKVVEIDIKPGGNPNNINLKSRGVVPVAALTTGDFDAGTIDPGTVLFAGASPIRWKLCDVDEDGDNDLLFHFKTQDLQGLDEDSTEVTLTGKTKDEVEISGTDTVRIVSPGTDTVRIVSPKKTKKK